MPRILGQDRPLEVLNAALSSGRVHHAWIFSGPRGVGKFTTAFEVARLLLDPDQRGGDGERHVGTLPDPESRTQHLINSGTHPDLHIIRKEMALYSDDAKLRDRKLMTIPIGVLRELVLGGKSGETTHEATAYRTAAMGVGKVFIIDEAELLAPEGQNAMLKTLEEPPANTWFFLITALPNRLIPTIHSRCQHVRFNRLDADSMQQWWHAFRSEFEQPAGDSKNRRASKKKGDSFDRATVPSHAAQWALEWAEGSPGMALMALEYEFHRWQSTLDPMLRELDRGVFPAGMGEALGSLVEEFATAWVKRHGERETSKDAANKDGTRHVLSILGSHARRRIAEHAGDRTQAEQWALAIDLLRECEGQINSNVNQKLAMDNLVAQWTAALSGCLVA